MCVCVFNHTVPDSYDTKIRHLCLPLETLALEERQTQIIFLPNDRGYKRHAHPVGRDQMHRLHAVPKQERRLVPGPTLEDPAHLPWAHRYALSQDITSGSFQVFIYSSLPKEVGFTRKPWHL